MKPWAVVLGASTGVGAACARALAEDEYNIFGFHRGHHVDEAKAVYDAVLSCDQEAAFYTMDAGTNLSHVDSALDRIYLGGQFGSGKIRVLVHSLSGASVGSILTINAAQIDRTFDCLAHSFLWWVQGLLTRKLLAPEARIIALSNPCPDFYLRNSGVIGAAKAALESYVRTLAVELGPFGHRVNAVRFSTVLTPALEKVIPTAALPRFTQTNDAIMPRGYMLTAEDVARCVVALVGPGMEAMNGAVVDLTGGAVSTLMDFAFGGPRP